MVDLLDGAQFLAQYQRAVVAANQASAAEPRAVAAYDDAVNHLIVIRLNSGAVFSFAADIAQGLARASKEDLAAVEITSSGTGLPRKTIDADFSLAGFLKGYFGTSNTKSSLATPDSAGQTTACPYGLAFWESGLCDSDLV